MAERPNIFAALVTAAGHFDFEGFGSDEHGEISQTFDEAEDPEVDFEPQSGEDETSDEEFIPPASDEDSPDEEDAGDEFEGDEEDRPSQSVEEEEVVAHPAIYIAKDGTHWGEAPASPFTKTKKQEHFQAATYAGAWFDDKLTRSVRRAKDPFAPFRDMWDEFNANLSKYYIAGPLLTIDEQLVPFRGRCNFLQYLPSKPDRYGIKIFWIVDSKNCFPLLGIPYLGRPLGQDRQVNLGRNTALQLAQPFYKTGRNVTCDNYFTDLALAEGCLKNGVTVVGTLRTNKRFLPPPFQLKKGPALHSSEFAYGTTATLVNYQGKKNKNTVVLSSMHDDGVVEEGAPKKKARNDPILQFYQGSRRHPR